MFEPPHRVRAMRHNNEIRAKESPGMSKDAFSNSDDDIAALSAYVHPTFCPIVKEAVAPNARGEAHECQLPLCS